MFAEDISEDFSEDRRYHFYYRFFIEYFWISSQSSRGEEKILLSSEKFSEVFTLWVFFTLKPVPVLLNVTSVASWKHLSFTIAQTCP